LIDCLHCLFVYYLD